MMQPTDQDNRPKRASSLQIIILGTEKKEALFTAMKRNVVDRWPIRYKNLKVSEVNSLHDDFLGESVQAEIQFGASTGFETRRLSVATPSEMETALEGFDRFRIAALFGDTRKILFIWLAPEPWFHLSEEGRLIQTPFYKQLVSLEQMMSSFRDGQNPVDTSLCIFLLVEKHSRFGLRPWMAYKGRVNLPVLEALERKAPKAFRLLEGLLAEGGVHVLPWSKNGSHLDYAPRWIDNLIFQELGLPKALSEH